jgi:hypothetical protein
MSGRQIAAYTGPDGVNVIKSWLQENDYISGEARIKQREDTVWAEVSYEQEAERNKRLENIAT